MKLRAIIIVLAVTSVIITAAGGYFFYSTIKSATMKEAFLDASDTTQKRAIHIELFIEERMKASMLLGSQEQLRVFLGSGNASLSDVNSALDLFCSAYDGSICYLMDSTGLTVASSNRGLSDSFVGKNYSFRPYFSSALSGGASVYMALGVTSGKRGIYFSYPVYGTDGQVPIGVAVIKSPIEEIIRVIENVADGVMTIIESHGIVFVSSEREWLYKSLWELSENDKLKLAEGRQVGEGPWLWAGLTRAGKDEAFDLSGTSYHVHATDLTLLPGWQVVFFHAHQNSITRVAGLILRMAKYIIYLLLVVVVLSVTILVKKAGDELNARQKLEDRLRDISVTDTLTGLYNRRGFFKLARHQFYNSCRINEKMCMYFIDIDDLKVVNDSYGHTTGDQCIKDAADLLKITFRKSDIVGRIGGDEFAVLMSLPPEGDEDEAHVRLGKTVDSFNENETRIFTLSLSVGHFVYEPDCHLEFEEFVNRADEVMYKKKRSKKEV